ncbi:PH domain-containing protein [Ilumatobacter sp.]|uniref:PH domain-containing protein n=1 Tax=Ilumatobacter sp. TaxID=1967498 RepID=UPI003C3BC36F
MAASQLDLMPGEKMILSENPHWWYFWKQVAAAVGILGLLVLLSVVENGALETLFGAIAAVSFVVLLIDTGYELVQWRTTRFAVTDQRVAYQSGVIRRKGVSIPLNRINNVNFEQSMIARMLNNGTVTIESAGATGDSVFENIPDPANVRTLIFKEMEADEQSDSNRDAAAIAEALGRQTLPPPTASAAPGSGAQHRLGELEQLRQQGLVSDAEYEIKRKQIVDDL